jgi:DUF4097 and DUF4098 domain-containing protein YvlB
MLLVFSAAAVSYGQDSQADRAEVPLTNPSKPALVTATLHEGSITVTGYNGKTIIVEARTREESKKRKSKKKAEGMLLIRNYRTGLSVTEDNNRVAVNVPPHSEEVELIIKVPYKTSLKLKALDDGYIKVEKVEGDLDVAHHDGPLTLNNVSGTVVAHSFDGDVTVSFEKVNLDKPMSFTTFDGDIDVTFPGNAKFNLKMKTQEGEIYSDFQLKMQPPPSVPEKESEKKKGKYHVKFDRTIYALLNGGGEEIQFKTFDGDIYIRKKK